MGELKEAKKKCKLLIRGLRNCIPKEVIEEKIKELKKQKNELKNKTFLKITDYINEEEKIDSKIQLLQELLEGK